MTLLNIRYWLKVSIFNLLIVAFLGMLMRYKIGFEFPFFNQKNIQHAHSHFAFLGWITHTIYVLILHFLLERGVLLNQKRYVKLIITNMLCSYIMMFSFITSGYSLVSIIVSTAAIVINYILSYYLFKDLNALTDNEGSRNWFKAALFFNAFSSLGTFALAYIIATKHFDQNWYLASVYFYLHFQYNGFFSFAAIGLLIARLPEWLHGFKYKTSTFWFIFLPCVPAYFLSTLWAKLPVWLYVVVVIAAFAQLLGWLILLAEIKRVLPSKTKAFQRGKLLFVLVALAFTIKLGLQLGSTIPTLSKLAFGFRPIVIAYLHLILLAVISVFLLAYSYTLQLITVHSGSRFALYLFVGGVFANEIMLAIQGIASFSYTAIPYSNQILFVIAVVIFTGITWLFASQKPTGYSLLPETDSTLFT